MKYIVIIGDGMADYPVPELGDRTPLQYARKPNMDFIARKGRTGLVKTIPDGIPPGSDAANLSVMGYDPNKYYTGRSPLEAASMGLELAPSDVALRCNLVTLSDEENYLNKTMIDYSSDEITTEEAHILIEEVDRHLHSSILSFHPGISYRHCMIWKEGHVGLDLTPPHDITGKPVREFLPNGEYGRMLLDLMMESSKFLKDHPVNKSRIERGLRPANSIWLWGEGRKPAIPRFDEKYGISGSVISAVDLIKGIGLCAGLKSIDVEGATGNINTNFKGKAEAALKELKSGKDFVYVHIEAPDESGHRYEIDNKVKSIEMIDSEIIGTILDGLKEADDFRILVVPDHPTPLSLRTHTREPVPFAIYQKSKPLSSGVEAYDEFHAVKTGIFIENGYELMDYFLNGNSHEKG